MDAVPSSLGEVTEDVTPIQEKPEAPVAVAAEEKKPKRIELPNGTIRQDN